MTDFGIEFSSVLKLSCSGPPHISDLQNPYFYLVSNVIGMIEKRQCVLSHHALLDIFICSYMHVSAHRYSASYHIYYVSIFRILIV